MALGKDVVEEGKRRLGKLVAIAGRDIPLKQLIALTFTFALVLPASASSQQEETYDYWRSNRVIIQHGQQAIFMCNGLFTSKRTLEQVFAQELAYLRHPVGTPDGGDYVVDRERKMVAIGVPGGTLTMRAAFREGLGCVIMAPDQTFEDLDSLPILDMAPPTGNPAETPWPDGDLTEDKPLPPGVDATALRAASNWAFERESPEQVTLSLLIVKGGDIIHERYAPGVDVTTRTPHLVDREKHCRDTHRYARRRGASCA